MKFRLSHCFVFLFACIIGTGGVSSWAEGSAASCGSGQYLENTECKDCPLPEDAADKVGEGRLFIFTKRTDGDDGIESCTIKLNTAVSKCSTSTIVYYEYVAGKYKLADNTVVAAADSYVKTSVSDWEDPCEDCPLDGTNAAGLVGDHKLFRFKARSADIGIESCAVELNPDAPYDGYPPKSNCDMDRTKVVYKYNYSRQQYVLDTEDYNVVSKDGYYILEGIDDAELTDHCGECSDAGRYVDDDRCKLCPLLGTNAAGLVGEGKRFVFVANGDGSCAVKLRNPTEDGCAAETEVVYKYDEGRYVRSESKVFPTDKSIPNVVAEDEMGASFCKVCAEGTYNVDNECSMCSKGWRQNCNNQEIGPCGCEKCPAGYYCPGKTDDTNTSLKANLCLKNTYSESGAGECTPCTPGYTTESSGSDDGLCLYRKKYDNNHNLQDCKDGDTGCFGVGCVSPDACKLTKSGLKWNGPDGLFFLGDNIKVKSVNKSVVKIIPSQTNN